MTEQTHLKKDSITKKDSIAKIDGLDLPEEFSYLKVLLKKESKQEKENEFNELKVRTEFKLPTMKPLDDKFDSVDEKYFSWYLEELYETGYISFYEKYPLFYRLSPLKKYTVLEKVIKRRAIKIKKKTLSFMQSHDYTPDFAIIWTEKARGVFFNTVEEGKDLRKIPFTANEKKKGAPYSVVEIKPSYDKHNMTRLFTLNQKWLFHDRGVYVQKVIVCAKAKGGEAKSLFSNTFTPTKYLLTDKKKQTRKLTYVPISLSEYIKRLYAGRINLSNL